MLRFITKPRCRNLSLTVYNNVRRRAKISKPNTETETNPSVPIPAAFFETIPTLNQYIRELNHTSEINLTTNKTDSDYSGLENNLENIFRHFINNKV